MYEISPWGVKFVQYWEKFRANAYLDAAGIPTIGYGTIRWNGKPVRLGMTITHDEAVELLMEECNRLAERLTHLMDVSLNQNQVDSLIDFMYNLGSGALERSSLRAAINTDQPVAEDLFTRWNKAKDPKTGQLIELAGLTRRRRYEYVLYIAPVTDANIE